MALLFAGPRLVLDLGARSTALWRPLEAGSAGLPPAAGGPLDIGGLWGWWDAASPASLRDLSGASSGGWRVPFATIANQVDDGPGLARFSIDAGAPSPVVMARLCGPLGGAASVRTDTAMPYRALHHDQGFSLPAGRFPQDTGWTWYLVWSRAAPRSGTGRDQDPSVLLRNGGRIVLSIQATPQGDVLVLHQDAARVEIAPLARHHTHSVIVTCQPGHGIDVWLDDVLLVSAAGIPVGDPGPGPTLLLHDGGTAGGAQCWFHEAATWPRALEDADLNQLRGHAGRWQRGARRRIGLLFNGQSNAVNYTLNDGAAHLLAEGVAWCLGALDYRIVASTGDPSRYTMQSGHGLYPAGAYPGSFLAPVAGADPSSWPLGADGLALANALQALQTDDVGEIAAIVWPWNETDSLRDQGERQTFAAAVRHFIGLERGMLGRSATEVPLIWWSAIPYGTDQGMAMHRSVVAELAADPNANVVVGNPQTADSNARGAMFDATTGEATGGDIAHRDADDNRRFARLAAPVVAHAIAAAGRADAGAVVPREQPTGGGPRIRHVQRLSATSLLLTVDHDRGTDLRIPGQAAQGRGFAVTDGDPLSALGTVIEATACERMGPSSLRITLASPMTHNATACALHYPFGHRTIGRGNAVTDNFADAVLPPDSDIGEQLGTSWKLDSPLAATLEPIPLSDTPAA